MNAKLYSCKLISKVALMLCIGACNIDTARVALAQNHNLRDIRYYTNPQVQHRNGYAMPFDTRVIVNGRQLSSYEVAQLRPIFGTVVPGSYWLLDDGTYGRVGGPALGNVYLAAQARNLGMVPNSRSGFSRSRHLNARDTLYVPGVGVLLPDGTSYTR